MEVATELGVSQSVISRLQQRYRETGRVQERHRILWPHLTLMNFHCNQCSAEPYNECHSTPGTFKGDECHVRPFETVYISGVCVLVDLQGYLTTPPRTGIIVLHGPESIYTGQGTSGPQCCSLMVD
ncbi:hypothetical protein XENORESO_018570 [Xenotaenia resolanae]|uniref:Uncharacterized protein n=1 Tax=Xenotaenia resolanae TaxID=208358 RepID=A0ABV0WTE2_9TELE